ncbi:MAG: dTDP-4-dehydrorhamnose reductase [Pseudomonadota bacterium]
MRILLTGSTGQVGHALQNALQGMGEIIIPARENMDLSQPELVRATIQQIRPDLIINPAAYTAVDLAEREPELARTINAIAPGIMAEEAKKLGAALIHYSTDYVFDGSKHDASGKLLAYTESDVPCPINVYGKTKLEGEQLIRASGCDHLILRTSWIYSNFGKNFLLTMLRLARERDELRVVNDQWGAPSSAVWLAATTRAIIKQLQATNSTQLWWSKNKGLYHLTPSGLTSWCGFAEEIFRLAKSGNMLEKPAPRLVGIPSSEYPTPARRPINSCLNSDLFKRQFSLDLPSWQSELSNCMTRQ